MGNSINTGMTMPRKGVSFGSVVALCIGVAMITWGSTRLLSAASEPQQASAADRSATALEEIRDSLRKMEPHEPAKKSGKAK